MMKKIHIALLVIALILSFSTIGPTYSAYAMGNQDISSALPVKSGSELGEGTDQLKVPEEIGTHLTFGNIQDEQRKQLAAVGTTTVMSLTTHVGALDNTYEVRTLEGKGSELSFQLFDILPNQPLTLEFEEIHTRSKDSLYYSVIVNSQEVYVRTYEEASAGPNHYFVEVPADVVGNQDVLSITLHNNNEATINFSRAWAYSNFEGLLADQQVNKKMTVGLMHPALKWNDYASDLALLNQLQVDYSNYEMYDIAVVFEIYYMVWSEEETQSKIDYLLKLSEDSGLPLHLGLVSWWAGTPKGPDGEGGHWMDIKYNQVVYDPLNINGRGNWQLSTPNMWSDTPWLSMNNQHYNEVRIQKIKSITQYISRRIAEMNAAGERVPPVGTYLENEPVYWPYNAFNASPKAGADFSPQVIQDASKDGVTLNPVDGLSDEEQNWLAHNLNTYISGESKAVADGFGYNAITIDNGNIEYPNYQLVENAYTHTFVDPDFGNWDDKKTEWETHMVKDIHFGGEYNRNNVDPRYLDYIIARGSFADVNAERGGIANFNVLQESYISGASSVNIYNYHNGDQQLIHAVDHTQTELVPTRSYDQSLIDYSFNDEHSLELGSQLVDAKHVQLSGLVGEYVLQPDNGNPTGGEVTFKMDHSGVPFTYGAKVQIKGRALTELNANCKIEVWAGHDPEHLQLVSTLKSYNTQDVDISNAIDKTSDTAYVKLKLFSTGLAKNLYNWTSVSSFKAYALWDKRGGHTNGFQYNEQQMRERNLWISYRADAEKMIQNYVRKSGENATYNQIMMQYQDDQYVTAYRLLVKALSETLPAKYVVKGSGMLGQYPLTLDVADTNDLVDATLYEYGDAIKIGLLAQTPTAAHLTVEGLNGDFYTAVPQGDGNLIIHKSDGYDPAAVKAEQGKAVFSLNIEGQPQKLYPSEFKATYVDSPTEAEGFIRIQSQDPEIGEYANSVELKLANDITVARGAEGVPDSSLQQVPLAMLYNGELLDITMNDQNEVQQIKAYYGKASGTITAIQPISIQGQLRNASIQLDNQETFEIGSEAVFHSPEATGNNILIANVNDLGLHVGDEVTIIYSPYTYKGSAKRVLQINQSYDILSSETFEESDGDWLSRMFSATNVKVAPLDTNFLYKVVRPDILTSPAELVWKEDSATSFTNMAIEFSGRAILDSSLKWYMSGDQTNWTEVQSNDPEGKPDTIREINLTDKVAGLSTVYIKCVIISKNGTWGSLNDVKIISRAAEDRALSKAQLSLGGGAYYAGKQLPLTLEASYDNGDKVYFNGGKVNYVIGDPSLVSLSGGSITFLKPGATTIRAYLSDGGNVIESNVVNLVIYDTITSETFEESDGDWLGRMFSATNVTVAPLDTNFRYKVVTPDDISSPAVLVWKQDSATPFTDMMIEFSGRAILGSSLKWYVSGDQTNWIEVQSNDPEGNPDTIREINLSDKVAGLSTVYIKCVIISQHDTQGSLNDIKILGRAAEVLPVIGGTVSIGGTAKHGEQLTADLSGVMYTPNTVDAANDIPAYQWKRDGTDIDGATAASYTLVEGDIGAVLTVTVTADGTHATGSVTSAVTATITKADGPAAPAAPTLDSKTTRSITLTAVAGQEYSIDNGVTWQEDVTFSGLTSGTAYTFVARVKETATQNTSAASDSATFSTDVGLTYTIATIEKQIADPLIEGYASGTQETLSIDINNTGTGDLTNVDISISGKDTGAFEAAPPTATTLKSGEPAITFTLKAKDGLKAGTYTAAVTVSANHMEDVTFTVTQAVNLPNAPDIPQNLAAVAGDGQVSLQWETVTGATYYHLYSSTVSGQYDDSMMASVTDVTYSMRNLNNGTTYYFVVEARNNGGASAASNEVSATPATVPTAPINVTAVAGDGQATISFTAPTDNGGSSITGYEVTTSPGNLIRTGTASPITFTGLTNGRSYTFTVKAINDRGRGPASTPSNAILPVSPPDDDNDNLQNPTTTESSAPGDTNANADVIVNGQVKNAGKATTEIVHGQVVTTITVDQDKLAEQLAAAGQGSVVTIPVNTHSDVVAGELNGQMIKDMESKAAVLEIKTENATYTIPAQQINIGAISNQIGKSVALQEINIRVEIAKPTESMVKVVENAAAKGEFTIIAPPINFTVSGSYGDTRIEVSQFNAYVERTIAIPDGVDPGKVTTGIVVDPDGTVRHVPTRIILRDGKYYAMINSLTNSTYSVVWHPLEFKDAASHWAREAINDMGSRMVISGTGNGLYEPDRSITRAEFAAIMVRALGLKIGKGNTLFTDVDASAWYSEYIGTAGDYGMISGYGDGRFGPDDKITREQAMTIVSTAINLTGLKSGLAEGDINALLADFGDSAEVAAYARESVAACVKLGVVSGKSSNRLAPRDNITRAEVAVMVRLLLQKSNLI